MIYFRYNNADPKLLCAYYMHVYMIWLQILIPNYRSFPKHFQGDFYKWGQQISLSFHISRSLISLFFGVRGLLDHLLNLLYADYLSLTTAVPCLHSTGVSFNICFIMKPSRLSQPLSIHPTSDLLQQHFIWFNFIWWPSQCSNCTILPLGGGVALHFLLQCTCSSIPSCGWVGEYFGNAAVTLDSKYTPGT